MAMRGRAPCEAGARSVSRACWASSTRASNMRAPWSRGSVSTSQPGVSGSTAGAGLVSGSRAARRTAPSSALPRPLMRIPPAASSVTDRKRPVCAARSSLARAASSRRSARSGSTTSARWRAVRASSVAVSRRDSSSSTCSPRSRSAGLDGRVSTASQMMAACAGEVAPWRRASRVAGRSVTSWVACATARRPSRRVSPARWVNQSLVEPQCSVLRARSRTSASANSCISSAASCPFKTWTAASPSTRSASENPVTSRPSSTARPGHGRSPAPLLEMHTSPRHAPGVRSWCPGTHPPGLHDLDASAPPNDGLRGMTRRTTASPTIRTYIRIEVKGPPLDRQVWLGNLAR